MKKNYSVMMFRAFVLLLTAPATAGVLCLNPNGACCPGCGPPDDPLGPRYRGESIAVLSAAATITGSPVSTVLPKTDSSMSAATVVSTNCAAVIPLATISTNVPSEFIVSNGEKYLTVSFAELASFSIRTEPNTADPSPDSMAAETRVREQVPAAIKSLSEKPVAITGFMLPVKTKDGLTADFLLLRNQSACCYGVMPKINEWVVVRTTGKGVKVMMDTPVTALGTFHIDTSSEDLSLTGIYQLDCDKLLDQTK